MGAVASKYRGFWRTLRCLAIGSAVARPAAEGDVRYSSVHQLFQSIGGTRQTWVNPFDPGSFPSRAASQRPVESQQAQKVLLSHVFFLLCRHGALKSESHKALGRAG